MKMISSVGVPTTGYPMVDAGMRQLKKGYMQ
jgi:deoxyribodipyrimidine photolyase